MLADIFNGRILIVNSGFRIVKDTFSLAEGKDLYFRRDTALLPGRYHQPV